MASSLLIQDHYPCPSHHGNRKTSGRAHQTRALKQEGDQLLVLSNQALPAPLHLAYISLLIATYSLATRRQMQLLPGPPPAPSFPLPPSFHFIFSCPLCPPLSVFSLTMPCPLCTRRWDCWGGRMGAGPQRGTGLLILFPC